ncbi:DUF2911 domain-containing protein [Ekhidna sp.]|uniref:DUF2911 domain-containing protein n=2 Tax=Ekhidna sp. TaxID=2608089 RepID=UPI003515E422
MKSGSQYRTYFRSKSCIRSIVLLMLSNYLISGCTTNPEKRPSPLRSDSTSIGKVNGYIEFSSPAVRGRQIFGEGTDFLVPYGKMWRTGANNATYVSFSADVSIDTFDLDSGSYSLFTIPNEDEWTIIFNSEWEQWGSYNHKDSLDVIRMQVKPRYADQTQERMLFYFADDSLKFRWDKVRWAIPIFSRL